ncbi:MAG: DNA polymerase III subunit gamma/tau [Saprospiraceae bacterium]
MSNFVVSARKYRPMRFDEVVGQQHVSNTLKNAMANNHLAHAFLFCGPRGVGKTTCARILAKVLNCETPTEDHEPCNTCDSCKSFNDSASFNITELDAASNNSVEHIRALIEQVRFQPQKGQFKIFIIDEVHMLSTQAFNAFLKTLEEPPPYAKFILATTEKHKIIPTILSRCQIFDFNRIQVGDIVKHLEGICAEEKITSEHDALHIIGQKADGALRDALSIFDRVVSFSGKEITYDDVITNLNVLDYDYYFRVVEAMLAEDVSKVLLIFDDILRKGFDPSIFVEGLAEHFRNILVCQDKATLKLLETGEALKKRYQLQSAITPASLLLSALAIANDCDVNYKMARNKRLHVEMALIRMTYIQKAMNAAQYAQQTIQEKKTSDVKSNQSYGQAPTTSSKVEEPKQPIIKKTVTLKKKKSNLLDSLDQEVSKENTIPKKARVELSQASLATYWKKYSDEKLTSNRTKNVFKTAVLKLNKDEINVIVSSNFNKSAITEERNLIFYLREQLHAPNLSIVVTVDKTNVPEPEKPKGPQILSAREKYRLMRQINPMVDELQKRFGLLPDK